MSSAAKCVLGMAAVLALAACEIETTSGPPPNAGRPGPGYGSPPGAPPPGAPAAPLPPPGTAPPAPAHVAGSIPPGKCAAGSVCFNIVPKAPGPIGPSRLVLFWTPPSDDTKVPPEIVPLATLNGNERAVVVPLSAVKPPQTTVLMGQAWGYVFAAPGAAPPSPKNAIGVANMMFVHAVGAQVQSQSQYIRQKFPGGIAEGTAPYTMQRPPQGHDNFLLAAPGSVFELGMCSQSAPSCELAAPNPS